MDIEEFKQTTENLYGKPCWNVQRGIGSFITLEFGKPHLEISEVLEYRGKQRRLVYAQGEWHLFVYCCNWKYFRGDEFIAHNESSDEDIQRAILDLGGQSLSRISFKDKISVFTFDLGGRLGTYPNDYYENDAIEQWFLYLPDDYHITFSANGQLKRESLSKYTKTSFHREE